MSNKKINELDEIRNYVGEVNKEITQNQSKNIIAYCRVSDSRQIDNNSPETQINDIKRYSNSKGFKVVKNFKILGESSRQGKKRPSINELFQFIKETKHKIHSIVVFHSNRLTRDGGFGAEFIDKLIKKGIGFTDLSEPNDIFTDAGRLRQINAFYGAEHENATRKKFINSTILEKLKQGYTMRKTPRGYTSIKLGKTKDQKIIINADGKLIKHAFSLKLNQNYSNVKIAGIMKSQGLDISYKVWSKIFKNVYYCGLIKDKRLIDFGGIVKGRHPKMITIEQYKIINNINGARRRVIKQKEVPQVPLRKHLTCSCCRQKLTGYKASKRKNLFYYKCRTSDCKINRSNKIIHGLYQNLLSGFSFNTKYEPQLNKVLSSVLKRINSDNRKRKKEISSKINSIQSERITAIRNMNLHPNDKDLYKELVNLLGNDITNLELQLSKVKVGLDEIENNIDKAIKFVNDLSNIWLRSDFNTRVKLQELVFPDGVLYDKKSNILTPQRINPIFQFFKDYKDIVEQNEENPKPKNPFSENEKTSKNTLGFRTSNNSDKTSATSTKSSGHNYSIDSDCIEKISLVLLPTHRSNNFGNELVDSMNELIRFIEWL